MIQFKIFLRKFIALEKEISNEKEGFTLFGLFLREEAPNEWDIVVSAPWLNESSRESLEFMTKRIQAALDLRELLMVSTVLILDPSQNFVREVNNETDVEHGNVELSSFVFNGMAIERAYIITSKRMPMQLDNLDEKTRKFMLDDLRTHVGVDTALGLPPGPNSGLSVRLPYKGSGVPDDSLCE